MPGTLPRSLTRRSHAHSALLANAYTRQEEYQADRHGVELLNRTGANGKALMVHTLTWL
jgi:predicted Zn-dependent protease